MLKWLKFGLFVGVVGTFFVFLGPLRWIPIPAHKKHKVAAQYTQFFIHLLKLVLRVHLSIKGNPIIPNGCFIVSNHMSYIDVLILNELGASVFITSKEVRETAVLGWIALCGGCFFVERRNPRKLGEETKQIGAILSTGIPIILFPEATSSNGASVLEFHSSLLSVPTRLRAKVVPMCINYLSIDGVPVTSQNADTLCWYDDMDFLPHLLKILSHRKIEVELTVLETLETDAFGDRKALSAHAYRLIKDSHRSLRKDAAREAVSRTSPGGTDRETR